MSKKKSNEKPMLTGYEHDAMWMSYRYAIGRHTAAATMHAGNMIQNVYGRLSEEQAIFDAFDMRREIAYHLQWELNFDMNITIPQEYYDPFKALIEFEKTLSKEDKEAGILEVLKNNRVAVFFGIEGYKFELHNPINNYNLGSLDDLLVWANTANALDPKKHHIVTTKYDGKEEIHDTFESYEFDKINGFSIHYIDIEDYLKNPFQYTYLTEKYIIKID